MVGFLGYDIFWCYYCFGNNGGCNLHQSKEPCPTKEARRKICVGEERAVSAKQVCCTEANTITNALVWFVRQIDCTE